jgi:hypothetical protein
MAVPDDLYAEPVRQPVELGDMEIIITIPDPTTGGNPTVRFGLQVKMSDGSVRTRNGNLWPHLTDQQKTNLQTFISNVYTMAAGKVLPPP